MGRKDQHSSGKRMGKFVGWILAAWESLSLDLIKDSFLHCALALPVDESADDRIHCFKDGEPCVQRREMLRSQLTILDEEVSDPFSVTESDIEDAHEACQVIDADDTIRRQY